MNLLFEVFLEELPTSEMIHLEEDLLELFKNEMKEKNIPYREPTFYLTPRRMALKFEFDEKQNRKTKRYTVRQRAFVSKMESPQKL